MPHPAALLLAAILLSACSREGLGPEEVQVPVPEVALDLSVPTNPEGHPRLSAAADYACALSPEGAPVCMGEPYVDFGETHPPPGLRCTSVAASADLACCVQADSGEAACWGDLPRPAPQGSFSLLDGHEEATCGLRPDGSATCFRGSLRAPRGTFVRLAVGLDHVCGLTAEGAVECRGKDDKHQAHEPTGRFVDVVAGNWGTCALRTDGAVLCWGHELLTTLPRGPFVALSRAAHGACALTPEGRPVCWGDGPSDPAPEGAFEEIVTGGFFRCGLRQGGEVVDCWGHSLEGQFPLTSTAGGVPATWVSVDAGGVRAWFPEAPMRSAGVGPDGVPNEVWAVVGDSASSGAFYLKLEPLPEASRGRPPAELVAAREALLRGKLDAEDLARATFEAHALGPHPGIDATFEVELVEQRYVMRRREWLVGEHWVQLAVTHAPALIGTETRFRSFLDSAALVDGADPQSLK